VDQRSGAQRPMTSDRPNFVKVLVALMVLVLAVFLAMWLTTTVFGSGTDAGEVPDIPQAPVAPGGGTGEGANGGADPGRPGGPAGS
jgi:hypothetical protein